LRNHNLNQYNDIAELLYALIAFDIYWFCCKFI